MRARRTAAAALVVLVAGCAGEPDDNAVEVANQSQDAYTVSLYESYAGGYQGMEMPEGSTGAIRRLKRGRYVVTFVHHIPATALTAAKDESVTRETSFSECCDTKRYTIQANDSITQ